MFYFPDIITYSIRTSQGYCAYIGSAATGLFENTTESEIVVAK
jgi:hypothetical protein